MTVATEVAAQSQRLALIIRIDGVAQYHSAATITNKMNGDARNSYCTAIPAYGKDADVDQAWFDTLVDIPGELSLRADEFGGVPDIGELSFSILDHDDHLTQTLKIEADSDTILSGSMTAATTTLTVHKPGALSTSALAWVGGECMALDSGTFTVRRGYAGTTASAHDDRLDVYTAIPYLRGRMVEMFIVPIDSTSPSDEVSLGSWMLDAMWWDASMNVWSFSCSSRMRQVGRMAPYNNITQGDIIGVSGDLTGATVIDFALAGDRADPQWPSSWFFMVGKDEEVVECNYYFGGGDHKIAIVSKHELAGTRSYEPRPGDRMVRVMVADDSLSNSSFQWSAGPSPETDRDTPANWTPSSHWLDIILNLLTSGADSDLVGSNYSSTYGNWAVLPAGFGAGVDISEIDVQNFMRWRHLTQSWRFPNFVFGHERKPMGEIIEEEFLKPIGAYFGYKRSTGQITINLPTIPLAGDGLTIGTENILMTEVGPGRYQPNWAASYPLSSTIGAIAYEAGRQGRYVELRNQGAASRFKADYEGQASPVVFKVQSADPDASWFLQTIMLQRLHRHHKPQLRVNMQVDMAYYDLAIGEIVAVDLPQIPNLKTGTRGHTSTLCEVLGTSVGREGGTGPLSVNVEMVAYTNKANVVRLAPSAVTSGSPTNNGDGTYTSTIKSNIFSSADVQPSTYNTDSAGFDVGDVVMIYTRQGTRVTTTTQAITAKTSTTLTFDGNFSATLADAQIVRFADSEDATADQLSEHTFMGDETDGDVPSGNSLYVWGYL